MQLNAITGNMVRRLLVNFRINPAVAGAILPAGVRPRLFRGHAIAGLCLVRLSGMRPATRLPLPGLASENVAVRMGVEWGPPGETRQAVLIFRRDTASAVNAFCGGRLLSGPTHRAHITVHDRHGDIRIAVRSRDGENSIDVAARETGGSQIPLFSAPWMKPRIFSAEGSVAIPPGERPGCGRDWRCIWKNGR